MKNRVIVVLTIMMLGSHRITAQFNELKFSHLNIDKGLVSHNITYLFKDSYGYLWISTENGLARFDGLSCKNFGPSSYTNDIIEDQKRNLWIGTQNGLRYYDRKKDEIKELHFENFQISKMPTYHYCNPFYIDDSNYVWFYSLGVVCKFNPQSKICRVITDKSNYINTTSQPFYQTLRLFCSNETKGFYLHKIKNNQSVDTKNFLSDKDAKWTTTVQNIYIDHDSVIWVTSALGLFEINSIKNQIKLYGQYNGAKINAIGLCNYKNKYLFVGTIGQGVLLFDKEKKVFFKQLKHIPNDPNSISSNNIISIIVDSTDHLYIATLEKGVDYCNLKASVFKSFFTLETANKQNISNNITALSPLNKTEMLIGTKSNGLHIYHLNDHSINYVNGIGKSESIANILPISKQNYLIQSKAELYLYNATLNKSYHLEITNSNKIKNIMFIYHLLFDKNKIYISTENGVGQLFLKNNHTGYIQFLDSFNSKSGWPNFDFYQPINDSVFIGHTSYTHFYAIKKQGNEYHYCIKPISANFQVFKHKLYKHIIFMATSVGLKSFDVDQMKFVPPPIELTSPCTSVEIGDDKLWVATSKGVVQYDFKNRKQELFTQKMGLQNHLFNPNAFIYANNILHVGTTNGFNVIEIGNSPLVNPKFGLSLENIYVNDRLQTRLNANFVRSIHLKYNENNIAMDITSIGFDDPEHTEYYYQLIPVDKNPVSVYGKTSIRYPKLDYGSYEFLLLSKNNLVSPHRLLIEISPPFWHRWWFRGLVCFVFLGIVLGIVKYRSIQRDYREKERIQLMLQSQEEERRRIANDLHDDFGARLSTLKLYMQAASKSEYNLIELLQNSSNMIDQSIKELRNILLNLSPKSLEENGLKSSLYEFVSRINKSELIFCEMDIESFKDNLNQKASYSIYRICLELINNTLKYAGAKNIYLSIVSREDETSILYEDDGMGFNIEKVKKGYGLNNIKTHVLSMDGTLFFDSSFGKGLAVTIEIPNKSNSI